MSMEASQFLQILDVIVIPAIGGLAWWLQQSRAETDKVKAELAAFKVEVATVRATNGFITEVRDELRNDVQRLEQKLDRLLEIHMGQQRPAE